MGRQTQDLTGQRFGRLLVLRRDRDGAPGHAKWLCWCDCGTLYSTNSSALRTASTRSCGCLHRERVAVSNAARAGNPPPVRKPPPDPAGNTFPVRRRTAPRARTANPATWRSSSRSYHSWFDMIDRCTNPSHRLYRHYGARGITVDPHWLDFDAFLTDMGERPAGKMTLERKDNDGPYAPWNCVWADLHQQGMNKRNTKLRPPVITEIKKLAATGMTQAAIAGQLGLNRKTVSRALSGKTRQRGK
jgi:hypothetical protein